MLVVFYLDRQMGYYFDGGLHPKSLSGLWRVLTFPFLHGSWGHLAANAGPILVAGTALFGLYGSIAPQTAVGTYLTSGMGLWLLGESGSTHIGASGWAYSLVFFLFFSGLFRRKRELRALSLLLTFLYGGMLWGMLPQSGRISWEGHLAGGLAGLAWAFALRRQGPQRRPYDWELEEDPGHQEIPHYWLRVPKELEQNGRPPNQSSTAG
jgi:membrane associated rhomboid family serine protease